MKQVSLIYVWLCSPQASNNNNNNNNNNITHLQSTCNSFAIDSFAIYLSKLYNIIGKYSEVNDVIKYMQKAPKTLHLLIVLTVVTLLIISRVQVAVL